jgi:3-oxoacyl-[acyl-carrier protein] reductase
LSGEPKHSRLLSKVAIITGSADGIGEAIAERFAEEGANLVLADINPERLSQVASRLKLHGVEVVEVAGDLTTESVANAVIDAAVSRFGAIDILINNVGGNKLGRIWEMKPEEWDRIIALNLRPAFLCTRAVAPHMIKRRYGRIVCTSSGAREGAPWMALEGGAAPYSTAKAGLHGFIRDMAFEFGEYGICINAVAAGAVNTKRLSPYFETLKASEHGPQKLTPLRRIAEPREIANAVLFLASDEASYITGNTLNVNGGR